MIIETKYNIGDKVWVHKFGKACKCIVHSIDIIVGEYERAKPYYWVRNEFDCARYKFEEREVFPTKEELLKSL